MSTETESLLGCAAQRAQSQDADDSESYWRVVTELHDKPSRPVFEQCRAWSASLDPQERRLGADVLGQLGSRDRAFPFREETIPILAQLLGDPDDAVVSSALVAFGHLGAEQSVREIAALSQHQNPDVRHAVAFSLLGLETAVAVNTLLNLSRDDDAHVRDWATFGLGTQIDLDTPQIRDALLARATDSDEGTRAEALAGLVRFRDPRVVQLLGRALESDGVGWLEVAAARDLGSSELVAPLVKLRAWWDVDRDLLESAISQCETNTPPEAG
jgi:HEAT repeat protein